MIRRNTLIKSFQYAYEGILYALRTQRNMRIHWFLATITMTATVVLDVSKADIFAVFFAIALVIGLELINTAIEKTVDLVTLDFHPFAKVAKDAAAGAVLFAAIFAILVGVVVFYQPLIQLRLRTIADIREQPVPILMAILGLLFFFLTIIISMRYRNTFTTYKTK
jgi:diacylglycerol kinase (ATP)